MFQPSKTKEPDSAEHAYNYALYLLGLSMRTEAEMRRKMTVRGYNEDIIEQVIQQLYGEKLLDDRNYVEVYIRSLKEYRTLGYYGIRKKLMEKLLPKDDIEKLLDRDFSPEEELKSGKKFMGKELKAGYKKAELTREQKQKLARKLQARGFRMDTISKLLF
jgi:regulatory protein